MPSTVWTLTTANSTQWGTEIVTVSPGMSMGLALLLTYNTTFTIPVNVNITNSTVWTQV